MKTHIIIMKNRGDNTEVHIGSEEELKALVVARHPWMLDHPVDWQTFHPSTKQGMVLPGGLISYEIFEVGPCCTHGGRA